MNKVIKTMMVAVAFVVLSGVAFAGYQNEPNGFRGLEWGVELKDTKGLVFLNQQGALSIYSRKTDKMKMGEAQLILITYSFWHNKLLGVAMSTNGLGDWYALKETTKMKFGKSTKEHPFLEEYAWVGKITSARLTYNQFSEEGMLVMVSTKLSNEMSAYDEQKAKEGAEKDF